MTKIIDASPKAASSMASDFDSKHTMPFVTTAAAPFTVDATECDARTQLFSRTRTLGTDHADATVLPTVLDHFHSTTPLPLLPPAPTTPTTGPDQLASVIRLYPAPLVENHVSMADTVPLTCPDELAAIEAHHALGELSTGAVLMRG